MTTLVYHPNPFKQEHVEQVSLQPGDTIRAWVDRKFPRTKEFPFTTVCLLNDLPLKRAEWDRPLKAGDRVAFVSEANWEIVAWVVVALVVGAAAMYVMTPTPKVPGGLGDPDPVYSIRGQSNQNRLGSQIEDPYGLNRLWPSKASREYTKFINNQQEIYILLCLGQGYYDLDNAIVQIEDTEISNFADITWEFYEPGDSVTLFPDNVETSGEVDDIELFAPNEPEYPSGDDGYSGPYAANSAGTTTTKLEFDFALPSGLYTAADDGSLGQVVVLLEVAYRLIDDSGNPIGAGTWTTGEYSFTRATNTPQRSTATITVPEGRYEAKARRTSNAIIGDDAHKTVENLKWVGLRAFLPSTKDYGDVTLLAVKARATNNLNGNSSNRINVITTRKLPVWNGTVWSSPTVTRSPVWAFCNALRAEYNLGLEDTYIDLETMLELDTAFAADDIFFDHVFDKAVNCWAMLETIARAANAIPMPNGSQVTMVLDEEKTVPKAVFTKENMHEGSFSAEYRLFTDDDHDGVEIEYEDPTSYQKETVSCLVGDDAGTNMEQIKLPGVKDRTRAWRIGMRIRETRKLRRTIVKFQTGLEGMIPGFNDLILVCHDVLDAGAQSGRVLSIDGTTVTTDTQLDWSGAETRKLAFRTALGEELGPFTVTEGASANIATLAGALTAPQAAELQSGVAMEKTIFAFGTATEYARKCRVTNITIGKGEEVEIEAAEDNATIYSHDDESPSGATTKSVPAKAPDLPTVNGLTARDIPAMTPYSQADWNNALGATSYVLQISENGTDWEDLGVTSETFYRFNVQPGTWYLRVAGVNAGRGAWSTAWTGTLGDLSGIESSGALVSSRSAVVANGANVITYTAADDSENYNP